MHSRTEDLLSYLEAQHESLRRAVESLPLERRTIRPSPDRWSVAEILEHVAIVEARLEKLFASKVAEARALVGPEEAALPDLHPWDRTRVLDRSYSVTAAEAVRPRGQLDPQAAWLAAEGAYQSFREAVRASDGVPLGRIVQPHPVFGPMNLHGWVEFVAGHEARHAAQILEMTVPH
jgi:uncharacterized damage-inducible protein DinB